MGLEPTVVALVGPSIGYRTFTEALVVSGTAPVLLGKTGINISTVVVRAADSTAYDPSTYVIAVAAGADGNITTTVDNTTSVARVGATIPDGTTIYVTYRYTDADYSTPYVVRDFDDVQAAFGQPTDPVTGQILSPLTLACQFAITNGAANIVLLSTPNNPVTRADLQAAYPKLDSQPEVNLIVPLPVGISGTTASPGDTGNVGSDLNAYIQASAALGILRQGLVGLSHLTTVDPLTTIANYKNKRIMHVYPNSLSFFSGAANTTLEIGGYYLAAAAAGRAASLAPQEPLTKKDLVGFSGLSPSVRATMTLAQKNVWSSGGIAVAELSRAGTLSMRHGTTTDRTNTLSREFSLVRARDSLVNLIQDTFDSSGLVGGFIDGTTVTRVQGAITSVLETALRYQIIADYSAIKVRQRPGDPQVIEVKFAYQPAYPLNYVDVIFAVDTATGETSLTQAA